ncbi:MAG: hypothetical protein OEW75_15845, partial [Cyclobacteriaceae bacterium]|nr:hypothetical protein [Cyclobacteriaceae bacterium]
MYFIFDSFFQFLFLLIISGVLFKFGRKKWSRIFFVAAFVWVFIISSTPLPYYLMKNLEKSSGSVADTDLL